MSQSAADKKLSSFRQFFQSPGRIGVGGVILDTLRTDFTEPDKFLEGLLDEPWLVTLIQNFAHRPQVWLHPSRLRFASAPEEWELFRNLTYPVEDQRFAQKVTSMIEREFDLPKLNYGAFSHKPWRLALLDLEQLECLAIETGLINLTLGIATLKPDETLPLMGLLGKETYEEILKWTSSTDFQLSARIPREWATDIADSSRMMGWNSLGTVFSDAPKSIVKRLELKLPRETAKLFHSGRKKQIIEPGVVGNQFVQILKRINARKDLECIF